MHTLQAGDWTVHYNSDWSGDAIVDPPGHGPEVRIPGHIFVAVAESICMDVVVAARDLVEKLEANTHTKEKR